MPGHNNYCRMSYPRRTKTDVIWHQMNSRIVCIVLGLSSKINAFVSFSSIYRLGFRPKIRALLNRALEIQSTSQHLASVLKCVYIIL